MKTKTGLTIRMKGNRIVVLTQEEVEREQLRKDNINGLKLWVLATICSGAIIYSTLKLTEWIVSSMQ